MRSPHTSYRWRGERVIEPIKCMRSPHTSYRWRGASHRANQVYALSTHQIQVERRESHRDNQVYALSTHQIQVERRESHRDNQVYALTTHQLQVERRESHRDNQVYALTTHQLQVERRESHRDNQVDGDYWEAVIDEGQWREFGQDTGVTPLLITRSAMGFSMSTESQDLGLTSHPVNRHVHTCTTMIMKIARDDWIFLLNSVSDCDKKSN